LVLCKSKNFTSDNTILTPPTVPINHYVGLQANKMDPRRVIPPNFNYELFNCNNINIRYWSWNYRGCWHQTCPPIVPR
ncbi:hypothetical protein BKA91DRAFT_91095, partial [Yarrowia lipolytica]